MVWYGKASEGFSILITAVVTASIGGIFKSVIGKKGELQDTDYHE